MIKRFRIDGYKSFRHFDLQLRPLTVIFSPNASGKCNFLDALYLLSCAVTARNLNLTLKTIFPSAAGIEIGQTKEGRVGLCLYENDFWFSSHLIYEGILRLIVLLCSIHSRNPVTTVAFEEPENGVHPVRLKIISDLFVCRNEASVSRIQKIRLEEDLNEFRIRFQDTAIRIA